MTADGDNCGQVHGLLSQICREETLMRWHEARALKLRLTLQELMTRDEDEDALDELSRELGLNGHAIPLILDVKR
jgi:hypothetical protein